MIDSVVILVFSLFILIVGISFSRTGTNLKSFFAGGESGPIIVPGSALGITGRAGITGRKPELILEAVQDKFENVVFVEDGLALGSAIMARCMNSMGTPKVPIGGKQGGRCILKDRMKMAGGKFA